MSRVQVVHEVAKAYSRYCGSDRNLRMRTKDQDLMSASALAQHNHTNLTNPAGRHTTEDRQWERYKMCGEING
jgi:hypothetical protein